MSARSFRNGKLPLCAQPYTATLHCFSLYGNGAWVYKFPNIGGAWPGLLWQLKRAWLQSLARMNNAALSHLGFVECRECEHCYSPCTYTHAWIVCSIPHKICATNTYDAMYVMHYVWSIVGIQNINFCMVYILCVYLHCICVVWASAWLRYKFWFEFSLVGWLVGIAQAWSPL